MGASEEMIYLDANVFIYAALEQGQRGAAAREILKKVHTGQIPAITSAITFDEIAHVVRKESDVQRSIAAGVAFLHCNNLQVIAVDRALLNYTLDIIKQHNLRPKDAIHYATMCIKGIKTIISNDADFDKIKEINRKSIEKFEKPSIESNFSKRTLTKI